MEEMILEPAAGVEESRTGLPRNPWMERGQIGLFRAWLRAVRGILADPAGFIRSVPANAPLSEGVLFSAVGAALTVAFGLVTLAFALGVVATILGMTGVLSRVTGVTPQVVALTVSTQILNGILTVFAGLGAGLVAHGVLVVLRGAKANLGRSVPAILYTQGASSVLSMIFCCPCNSMLSPIWWCAAMTAMLRVVHSAPLSKALTASIIAMLTWIGAYFVATWGVTSAINPPTMRFSTSATPIRGDDLHTDEGPCATPFDAVVRGNVAISDLLELIAEEDPMKIGGLDRESLRLASDATLEQIARQLESVLPPGNGPFRLGRAVFCYRDTAGDEGAWQVIVLPSEAATRPPVPPLPGEGVPSAESSKEGSKEVDDDDDDEDVWLVVRGHDEINYSGRRFPRRLKEENQQRVSSGASVIPDPATLPDLLPLIRDASPRSDGPSPAPPTTLKP
jgi:hypothetical protein